MEQDADIVTFLYRPEYYDITEVHDSSGAPISTQGLAEIIIAKHRNGATDTAYLKFIGAKTKFVDWEQTDTQELTPIKSIDTQADEFFSSTGDEIPM